jgi:hypothetical protein
MDMSPDLFIAEITKHVLESAISGTEENLQKPSGRYPPLEMRRRSEWYNTLTDADRAMVLECIERAAHAAVFGFLAVLDGSRTIGSEAEKEGEFVLEFRRGEERALISDGSLHERL